jgi:hypothetical protein
MAAATVEIKNFVRELCPRMARDESEHRSLTGSQPLIALEAPDGALPPVAEAAPGFPRGRSGAALLLSASLYGPHGSLAAPLRPCLSS